MASKTKLPEIADAQIEVFISAYLACFDAGKAYTDMKPTANPKTARQSGYQMLQRPAVKKRLQELTAQRIERHNVESDRLIAELERIAFFDPDQIFEVDEQGEPVLDLTALTPENRRLLKIEFGVGVTKDGDRVRTYKVQPHDKMEAVEKLLKLHQLYKGEDLDKQPAAIVVNVNIPIPGQSWRNNQAQQSEPIEHEDV